MVGVCWAERGAIGRSAQIFLNRLAQRAGQRAVEQQGQRALGKLMGNKGLGAFLGGGGNPNAGKGGSGGNNQPANPLDQLKGLFGR